METAPADEPPEGAVSSISRVTPDGIATSIAPVIANDEPLVVMLYVVELSDALVGWLPAVAVLIVNAEGLPETEISLIELIVKVTVALAVLAASDFIGRQKTEKSRKNAVTFFVIEYRAF